MTRLTLLVIIGAALGCGGRPTEAQAEPRDPPAARTKEAGDPAPPGRDPVTPVRITVAREELLYTIPPGDQLVPNSLTIGPDFRHLAFATAGRNGWAVVRDGVADDGYQQLGKLTFSPDGSRLAFLGRRGGKTFVAIDGRPAGHFDDVTSVTFSPDGRRVAYVGVEKGQQVVMNHATALKRTEYPPYDGVGQDSIRFSPDGLRIGFTAHDRKADRWFAVIDGEEQPRFADNVLGVTFSPDGKRWAYAAAAEKGKNPRLVVGGDLKETFRQGEDGVVLAGSLTFSPDGKELSYVVRVPEGFRVVTLAGAGRTAGRVYDRLGPAVYTAAGELVYPARKGADGVVVAGGKAGPSFAGYPHPPLLDPKRARVAYTVPLDYGKAVVVLDGKAGQEYDQIPPESLRFSPDGRQLVYAARSGAGWELVRHYPAGVATGRRYDALRPVGFSPSGSRVVYAARAGTKAVLVVNGTEWGAEGATLPPAILDDRTLELFVVRSERLYRIRLTVEDVR